MDRCRLALTLILVASVAALTGCRNSAEAARRSPNANVLLITLDTTRADHLGCYGHAAKATPNLDRLAAEGVRFTQCTAQVPITLPSHASILTGLDPFVHGARDNGRYHLDERGWTLAEHLADAGYVTAAHVAAFVLNAQFGLSQGFQTYDDVRLNRGGSPAADAASRPADRWAARSGARPANEIADAACAWLRTHQADRFFLWVHFFDPHQPYTAPQRIAQRYPNDGYLAEIAFADEQLGRVIAELETLGLTRNTLVAVVADHGEGLGEHHEESHAFFVYDTTLHVPLILRGPGALPAGRTIAAQVRTIDLAPTILDCVALPPLPDAQGTSLWPLIAGQSQDLDLPAYGETLVPLLNLNFDPLHCLRYKNWKYIHAQPPELYDLAADPGERQNLASQQPERVADLRQRLYAYCTAAPVFDWSAAGRTSVDHATAARLRSLGYVADAGPAPGGPGESFPENIRAELDFAGPNPMTNYEAIDCIATGVGAMLSGRYRLAESLFSRLAQLQPQHPIGRRLLVHDYSAAGNPGAAVAVARDLLEQHPHDQETRVMLGFCLAELRRYDEAEVELRAAATQQPEDAEAWYQFGRVQFATGRFAAALESLARASALDPEWAEVYLFRGECHLRLGQTEAADADFARALELKPTLAPQIDAARRRAAESAGD